MQAVKNIKLSTLWHRKLLLWSELHSYFFLEDSVVLRAVPAGCKKKNSLATSHRTRQSNSVRMLKNTEHNALWRLLDEDSNNFCSETFCAAS
jgi:hypothetical protein